MVKAAVDTDILFKCASYGLLFEIIDAIPSNVSDIGVLGAATFVVRDKIRKTNLNHGPETAVGHLEELVQHAVILETTIEEVRFAAELEFSAQCANVYLDEGESQLCAIVIERALPWLLTGDKRAVQALEILLGKWESLTKLAGKVICLEQLFLRLVGMKNATVVRDAVCGEPGVDRVLAICFSCHSLEVDPESWSKGLSSYIAELRDSASTVLAD